MKKSDFYLALADMLECEPNEISDDTVLADLPTWDSLAVLSFVALADSQLGVTVEGAKLSGCKTVSDLIALVPGAIVE